MVIINETYTWSFSGCPLLICYIYFFFFISLGRKLVDPLNNLILKGYKLNTVIRSLNIVFNGNNIDFIISKLKAD